MKPEETPARRARRGQGGVTLHDVAKLAGVAPISASRALNTPNQVSPELLARVTDAVARTGYVPNRMAGGLASARSRLVAAVVPTISGPVFQATIQALTLVLAERGYQLMLGQSGYTHSREDDLLDAIIGRRPDGIVLTGVMRSPVGRKRLLASGIPVVETWDLTPTPLDMLVGFSHEAAGQAVAGFLVARGRRRLAMIAADDDRSGRRSQAFERATVLAGLSPPVVIRVEAPTTVSAGRRAMVELLDRTQDIDAVFCSSDLVALGAMTEAQARGMSVPGQVAVVGFGDLEFAAALHPALTTVHIDGASIGQQAAKFILDRASGLEVAERVVDVGFSIIQRSST
jgi:LacI family transcriptional regulator, gluconate utilization system Gnt-I transcriptional repressor